MGFVIQMHKHFVGSDGIGYVALVDTMPRENLDRSIVNAARVSYDVASTKHTSSDRGLIRYLMRHWHTTPFEMVEFKFVIKMPLFVARQHFRHRTASVNELSARYSEVKNEFFVPGEFRKQAEVNRQGSTGVVDENSICMAATDAQNDQSHRLYMEMINGSGVCREQARVVLPQSMYTEFYWKIDLHNLMHYLHLRMGNDAQKEIRDYADKIYEIIAPLAPHTFEAFKDFRLNAVQFSGIERKMLAKMISGDVPSEEEGVSKGELREFKEKILSITNETSCD